MNHSKRVFSRALVINKETNILQNICLIELPFLRKITTEYKWNLSFLEVCMHLISNFTCKDKIFKRISGSCDIIFLNETIVHKCSKKGFSEIFGELMLYFIY